MDTVTKLPGSALFLLWILAAISLSGCQDQVLGMTDNSTPLATIQVQISGDFALVRAPDTLQETPHLRAALVWGQQYVSSTFCYLYNALPLDPSAAAVADQGCRDPFGFVPLIVAADAPVIDGKASIPLVYLPLATQMVGDLTGRIAHGAVVIYDDRNGDEVLNFRRDRQSFPEGVRKNGGGPNGGGGTVGMANSASATAGSGGNGPGGLQDYIYGSSFVSMLKPDQRITFREAGFDVCAAFYPRAGCPAAPAGFSIGKAGGFSGSVADITIDFLTGNLPAEAAGTCQSASLSDGSIDIALQPTETFRDVMCQAGGSGGSASAGSTNYLQPGTTSPDLTRPYVCLPVGTSVAMAFAGYILQSGGLPKNVGQQCGIDLATAASLSTAAGGGAGPGGGSGAGGKGALKQWELVVSGSSEGCRGVGHYVLRGCANDASCADNKVQWDVTAAESIPSWWPCPKPEVQSP